MEISTDLGGVWTYRSFENHPTPVTDFNAIKVWEAELSVTFVGGRDFTGYLGERPQLATGSEPYLFVTGAVLGGEPCSISWRAVGKPGSSFDGWIYDYRGYVISWTDEWRRHTTIVGSAVRVVAHGMNPAGETYSFVAVRGGFKEPRVAAPLSGALVAYSAAPEHRYAHALWHASRDEWGRLADDKREHLRKLGWQPGPTRMERPTLGADRLQNGCGEDFFYMHRRMLSVARNLDPALGRWDAIPFPAQLASFERGTHARQIGNLDGNAVPPAWHVPGFPAYTAWLFDIKSIPTLNSLMRQWEDRFTDVGYLASVSLGELGWWIEFTIHNVCHLRWASIPRDPSDDVSLFGRPVPLGKHPLDFDEKWLKPVYDHFGDPFAAHVNPLFWRLHAWVDERVEDWYRAQETVRPGVVQRREVGGVDWFRVDGDWVKVDSPWEGPMHQHGEEFSE